MSGNSSWANPAPAGLVALAVACFTFYAILTGKVDGTAAPLLGCWIIGGFVVQLIVGLIELMEAQLPVVTSSCSSQHSSCWLAG